MKAPSILLVDDEAIILETIGEELRSEGLQVKTASNAETAIALLDTEHFQVVITDLMMEGLKGTDVLKKAKEINPQIGVIIITGYGDMNSAIEALRLGADDYLVKPCEPEDLMARVNRCLDKQDLTIQLAQALNEAEYHKEKLEEQIESKRRVAEQLERSLKSTLREKSKTESILAAIGEGLAILDRELIILYQNNLHRQLVGNCLGMHCYTAYENKNASCPACPVIAVFEDGEIHHYERTLTTKNGKRTLAVTTSPLRDESGDITAVIEVSMDITDKHRLEQEIIKIRNLESIGQLAGGIAHDFNNILTAILGNIELAEMYLQSTPAESTKMLHNAKMSSLQARQLTQQLLTFAKGGGPNKALTSVEAIIGNNPDFALSGSNIRLEKDLPADLWQVEADLSQMGKVLQNITLNAREAMPEGGTLLIRARNKIIKDVEPLPLAMGNYVHIMIVDEGFGIPASDLNKIFDPYYTQKELGTTKGMGLGLTICHSIIAKHQGHIQAESNPGKGTTISIYLPAAAMSETRTVPALSPLPEPKPAKELGGKILIMDDEPSILELAVKMLEHLGFQADTAPHGKTALKLYKEQLKKECPYGFVILDLTIKGGWGGEKTIQELKKLNPDIKAIVSSGYANDPILINYREHGFAASVSKPFKLEELKQAIAQISSP